MVTEGETGMSRRAASFTTASTPNNGREWMTLERLRGMGVLAIDQVGCAAVNESHTPQCRSQSMSLPNLAETTPPSGKGTSSLGEVTVVL